MDESEIMTAEGADGFLDGWEETTPASGEPEGGNSEAPPAPEAEEHEKAGGEDQTGEQQPPRTWTLNHLGKTLTAGEADAVALAQKGLDCGRIRSEYDEAKPVMAMFRDFAGRAGMNPNDYLTHIRLHALRRERPGRAGAEQTRKGPLPPGFEWTLDNAGVRRRRTDFNSFAGGESLHCPLSIVNYQLSVEMEGVIACRRRL